MSDRQKQSEIGGVHLLISSFDGVFACFYSAIAFHPGATAESVRCELIRQGGIF